MDGIYCKRLLKNDINFFLSRSLSFAFLLIFLFLTKSCCNIHFLTPKYYKHIDSKNIDFIGQKCLISSKGDKSSEWCFLCDFSLKDYLQRSNVLGKIFCMFFSFLLLPRVHKYENLHDLYIFWEKLSLVYHKRNQHILFQIKIFNTRIKSVIKLSTLHGFESLMNIAIMKGYALSLLCRIWQKIGRNRWEDLLKTGRPYILNKLINKRISSSTNSSVITSFNPSFIPT